MNNKLTFVTESKVVHVINPKQRNFFFFKFSKFSFKKYRFCFSLFFSWKFLGYNKMMGRSYAFWNHPGAFRTPIVGPLYTQYFFARLLCCFKNIKPLFFAIRINFMFFSWQLFSLFWQYYCFSHDLVFSRFGNTIVFTMITFFPVLHHWLHCLIIHI